MKCTGKRGGPRAQTFLEYTLLLGIVTALMLSMLPLIRRGIQGVVKAMSDQIGAQVNADVGENREARLLYANSTIEYISDGTTKEFLGDITYTYEPEFTNRETETKSILGLREYVPE